MRAGRLDRKITVQRLAEAVSVAGTVTRSWTTLATVRAELLQDVATEAQAASGEAETIKLGFRIRYLPGITTADRVTYGGANFDLVELKEIGRRRGLELRCERVR